MTRAGIGRPEVPLSASIDSDSEIPKALAATEVNFHQGGEEKI